MILLFSKLSFEKRGGGNNMDAAVVDTLLIIISVE